MVGPPGATEPPSANAATAVLFLRVVVGGGAEESCRCAARRTKAREGRGEASAPAQPVNRPPACRAAQTGSASAASAAAPDAVVAARRRRPEISPSAGTDAEGGAVGGGRPLAHEPGPRRAALAIAEAIAAASAAAAFARSLSPGGSS